jgi:uncharacterized protein YjiS (DUF1127 family)
MIFAGLIARIAERYRKHKAYENRLAAYSLLTDRDLAEIGFSRSDIVELARLG